MTMRSIPPILLVAATSMLVACPDDGPPIDAGSAVYVDEWREEISGSAAQITKLSIGDQKTSDNFANRGDIEVRYVNGTDQITVEMQRFTIAKSQADADASFGRMELWAYNISAPSAPKPEDAPKGCFAPDQTSCYIRNYYGGQLQPLRDGVNFRVTIPRGWNGDLELITEDNLEAGIDTYPDRSDIIVDGVAGNLLVQMDSGNIQVRMDPETNHFSDCPSNDPCVEMGFPMGCGCTEPTNIDIANDSGQASNMTVDVGNPDAWYTMVLENRSTFSDEIQCTAKIDCGPFDLCEINEDFEELEYHERAEINYPGEPAVRGAGVRISLISESCANISYAAGPDYELEEYPLEHRGDLEVCVGCLDDL